MNIEMRIRYANTVYSQECSAEWLQQMCTTKYSAVMGAEMFQKTLYRFAEGITPHGMALRLRLGAAAEMYRHG